MSKYSSNQAKNDCICSFYKFDLKVSDIGDIMINYGGEVRRGEMKK